MDARIVGTTHLIADRREIDGEFAVLDPYGDIDGDRLVEVDPVIVEKASRLVDAVRDGCDRGARRRFRVAPDRRDCREHQILAMPRQQRLEELPALDAGGMLSGDVAKQHFRQPGVVFDDPQHLLHQFAAPIELHRAQVQSLLHQLGRVRPEARTGIGAADVDPMHGDDHEGDEPSAGAEDRRVHRDIVEMLAEHAGIVGEDHIPGLDPILPIGLECVAHREPHDDGEQRQPVRRLRNAAAVGIDDPDGVILVLVDQRTEGGAHQVRLDQVGNGLQRRPDDLELHRIDRRTC